MKGRNRLIQHRCRWKLAPTDGDEIEAFRNRLISALDDAIGLCIVEDDWLDKRFAQLLGLRHPTLSSSQDILLREVTVGTGKRFAETLICEELSGSKTLGAVAEVIQVVFWVFGDMLQSDLTDDQREEAQVWLDDLVYNVQEAVDLSPDIDIKLVRRGNSVTLYPGGAKALDEATVEDVLGFLGRSPRVAEKFEHVLRTYLGKNPKQARTLLDDLRFCLEQLVRDILKNRKSLENQKAQLGVWLEGKGVHTQIRNMYSTLINQFAAYQNDAIKHDEKWSFPEVEFMIYQTGIFMRMLLELEGTG